MASTERELCIDCGRPVPGGGFCRECLAARIRLLDKRFQAMNWHQRLRLRVLYAILGLCGLTPGRRDD